MRRVLLIPILKKHAEWDDLSKAIWFSFHYANKICKVSLKHKEVCIGMLKQFFRFNLSKKWIMTTSPTTELKIFLTNFKKLKKHNEPLLCGLFSSLKEA